MSIDQKVHKRDLYEKQWQSRDFEISHLWQRSVFLATSIVLSFTAYVKIYGVYFSKDYNLSIFTVFVVQNLICIFGFCFAVLWFAWRVDRNTYMKGMKEESMIPMIVNSLIKIWISRLKRNAMKTWYQEERLKLFLVMDICL